MERSRIGWIRISQKHGFFQPRLFQRLLLPVLAVVVQLLLELPDLAPAVASILRRSVSEAERPSGEEVADRLGRSQLLHRLRKEDIANSRRLGAKRDAIQKL